MTSIINMKQYFIIDLVEKTGGDYGNVKDKEIRSSTMKPIELIAIALRDNPSKKIVYDGFGGSGSTLIA